MLLARLFAVWNLSDLTSIDGPVIMKRPWAFGLGHSGKPFSRTHWENVSIFSMSSTDTGGASRTEGGNRSKID